MPEKTLAEFAATFDRASLQPRLREAEEQRRMILESFPLSTFGELPLERYALREKDRSTFCYLLEFGSTALGSMKGGNADKLGIYFYNKTGQWKCAIPGLSDVGNAWKGLRSDFITAADLVRSGQFELIDALPVASYTPSLRTKWLHVLFPEEVIPIYSFAHLVHYIRELGGDFIRKGGKSTASANRHLVELVKQRPELQGWSLWEIANLLWTWNPPAKKPGKHTANGKEAIRWLKIAPGRGAMAWQECLDQGYICVGWDEVGDLGEDESAADIEAKFNELEPPQNGEMRRLHREQAQQLWTLRELEPGDKVVANQGISKVLGVGTVTEPGYTFDDSRSVMKHTVSVQWDTSFEKTIPKQPLWAFVTVADLTEEQKNLILGTPSPTPLMPTQALNQILYGPPGTGKTYRVIREAAAIIAGQPITDDLAAKTAYDQAGAEGRIRLATFHQSFSYEDFIEGIRPVMEEDGKAAYQVRDGIFKEIAMEALFACLEATNTTEHTPDFEEYWDALLLRIAEISELEIPGIAATTWILAETEKGNLEATNKVSRNQAQCGKNALAHVWRALHPKCPISYADSKEAYGKGARHEVIAAVYNFMQKLGPAKRSGRPEYNAEQKKRIVSDYLELGPASGWQLRADKNFPPYVLIIDEINRGNISRIFGELITLIEDDKREGEANALRVTLPSSREPFTVPPNLYLLGTMNTADKSLALLDVALRRRFEFRELAPDFTACADLPEEMRGVLKRLNERIELRKDRDHRIGHAFFMGVKDAAGFNRDFVRKVVPLLQEYFFNDIDGARFVLGEIGRESEPGFLRQITAASADAKYQRNRWRWFTDVEPGMDCWSRLRETLGS
jgi:5-methylcytosine-specific restriction protein B